MTMTSTGTQSEKARGLPYVSILICTRNRADSLRDTLETFRQARPLPGFDTELIIVDNASTDHTAQVAQSFVTPGIETRYIREEKIGLSCARNTALQAAKGRFILFTDDDVRVPATWLITMCSPLIADEADVVQGFIQIAPCLVRGWMTEQHRSALFEILPAHVDEDRSPFLIGANFGFHRRVLETISGFDEALGPGAQGYGDDALFAAQLIEKKFRFVFIRKSIVEHHFPASRLLQYSWYAAARKHGKTSAYLTHHWSHIPVTLPYLRLSKNAAQFAFRYVRDAWRWRNEEGIPYSLVDPLQNMFYYYYYLQERRKPRLYERHGMVKRKIA